MSLKGINYLFSSDSNALTVAQSNALKGVAIFSVILGHNHILAPVGETLFGWLYSFHLVVFFILPFFYNKPVVFKKEIIASMLVKNYVPFAIFFIIHYCLYLLLVKKTGVDLLGIGYAIFNGSSKVIKETSGFVFLWFLPAYFSFSLVRMTSSKSKLILAIFFIIGMAFSLDINYTWNVIFRYVPFGFARGIYYFTFGVIALFLINTVPYIKYVGSLVFLVLSVVYCQGNMPNNEYFLGISAFFFFITTISFWEKIPGLQFLGKYSLGIYLFHVLVYNVLERILPNTLFYGWVIFVITIGVSLLLTLLVMNTRRLRQFIFPRQLSDWFDAVRIVK